MPMKLNVGLNQKRGEPNYGSRGASFQVEVEIDSSVAIDPRRLRERARALYAIARKAIDEELDGREAIEVNGSGRETRQISTGSTTLATAGQVRAVFAICRSQELNPFDLVQNRFGRKRIEDLSIREASCLIDELKRNPDVLAVENRASSA
ncbi:hypothetical protein N9B05_05510 [Mariniblastus sp.]|nr:hypothetical protein [Mariniblastus sp.]